METGLNLSYFVAFTAGILIFLSPCVLPLIPSYIAYLTGMSLKEIRDASSISAEKRKEIRILTVSHSLLFILGFTIVFVLLGATATYLGSLLSNYLDIIKKIGGILIIFFGLYILGVIKIDFLQKERQVRYTKRGINFVGSILIGATFAAAWTPCVGPILGSVLVLAAGTADVIKGIKLLTAFSLGLGVPFFLSSLAITSFLIYFQRFQKYIRWVTVFGGIFLIVIGVLVLTDNFNRIVITFIRAFTK